MHGRFAKSPPCKACQTQGDTQPGARACQQVLMLLDRLLQSHDIMRYTCLDSQSRSNMCAKQGGELMLCAEAHLTVVLYSAFLTQRGGSNEND